MQFVFHNFFPMNVEMVTSLENIIVFGKQIERKFKWKFNVLF
jgi:hypothetical protein